MIVERLTSGLPLLSSEELEVNQERMRAFFRKVVVLISVSLSEHGGETNALSRIADEDSVWKQAASSWYEGASLNPVADVCGVNSDLLGFVFQITFRPFLAFYAESLLPKIDQESWRRRYCPICGGKPDFAFLQRESGARWLVCSRCDAEWLFQRLECPYCGNHDQNTLSYFAVDEEPYRLYVCEVCQKYIKAIDLRVAREDVLIPLEKVLTLDLDRQAQEKGYMPG
jgi:FdhE protein